MSDQNNNTSDWCQRFLKQKGSGHPDSSFTSYALALVALILITIVTVISNAIVLLALTVGRGKPSSYTLSLTFTLSLVVSDLMLAGLVMPISTYNIMSEYWELGPMACRVFMSADITLCSASILNMVGLALDRYLAVRWPLLHLTVRTNSRLAVGLCVVIWVLSALLSFPFVMTDLWFRGVEKDPGGWCLLQIFEQGRVCAVPQSPVYQLVAIGISFFLPLLCILGFHAKVYAVAHAHTRRPTVQKLSRGLSLASSPDDLHRKSVFSIKGNELKQKLTSVDRTTKAVLCLVLCFVVCWLPVFITLLVDCFNSYQVPSSVLIVFTWLGYINSGLNPILYYRFNAGIRYAIRCFLCLKTSPAEN